MREQLNSNPLVQVAVIAVLLIGAGFFLLTTMGGGGEEESESASSESATVTAKTPEGEVSVTATVNGSPEAGGAAPTSVPALPNASAPPPPQAVLDAYEANRAVVLLFVREGGIDDRKVRDAVTGLEGSLPDAAVFVVPADRIARYAAITQGVAVDRVPALVVVRPKDVGGDIPVASVSYGFQSPQSVVQAVVDAGYEGRTLDYHP